MDLRVLFDVLKLGQVRLPDSVILVYKYKRKKMSGESGIVDISPRNMAIINFVKFPTLSTSSGL